jgi:flavin-dependent dehydrogenase
MERFDLIVIGGGPAGAAAGITAARAGKRALLLERGRFPRHKVCGEFISPEATGLLRELLGAGGAEVLRTAPAVDEARLFVDGRTLSAPVSPPALSLPRFWLDQALWRAAEAAGCTCREETLVEEVTHPNGFVVRAGDQQWQSDAVVSASGRWSNLARTSQASVAPRWLGVKAHFREAHPHSSVDLYFFDGGYCGVQPVGEDAVNACAMVRADVASTLDQVFARHPDLWRRSRDWEPITEPVSTAPLIFRAPVPADASGVLNAGDAAGFIDPFAGDGIAIALRSGARATSASAGDYARWYGREILPAFRAAARFRRLMSTPAWARKLALSLLGNRRMAAWAVRATRGRG